MLDAKLRLFRVCRKFIWKKILIDQFDLFMYQILSYHHEPGFQLFLHTFQLWFFLKILRWSSLLSLFCGKIFDFHEFLPCSGFLCWRWSFSMKWLVQKKTYFFRVGLLRTQATQFMSESVEKIFKQRSSYSCAFLNTAFPRREERAEEYLKGCLGPDGSDGWGERALKEADSKWDLIKFGGVYGSGWL